MGRGHQLDPGTKRRSGGYTASSPSGPGATNPRGKKLEYKHEARKRKAQSFYGSAFFAPQRAGRSIANAHRATVKNTAKMARYLMDSYGYTGKK